MPYVLISTGPQPQMATQCTVICDQEIAGLLMATFEATLNEDEDMETKPLLKRAYDWIRRKKEDPKSDVPRYNVPTQPHHVITLLEKIGYKVNSSATNKETFIWTLHKEVAAKSPRTVSGHSTSRPGPSPTESSMEGAVGFDSIVSSDVPVGHRTIVWHRDPVWHKGHQYESIPTYERDTYERDPARQSSSLDQRGYLNLQGAGSRGLEAAGGQELPIGLEGAVGHTTTNRSYMNVEIELHDIVHASDTDEQ